NSYGSLEEAAAWFASSPLGELWLSADVERTERAKCMIEACDRLEQETHDEEPATSTQRLHYPRSCDGGVIPEDIKICQYETAYEKLVALKARKDSGARNTLSKFSSIKIGGIAITMNPTAPMTNDGLRASVWRRLSPYLRSGA